MNKCRINIILTLLLIVSANFFAQDLWNKEIHLSAMNTPLRDVLIEIRNKSGLNLIFDDNLTSTHLITYNYKGKVNKIISEILQKSDLKFKKYSGNTAVVFKKKTTVKIKKTIVESENASYYVLDEKQELIKPILLSGFELKYPKKAINNKLEGEVYARFKIDKDGRVKNINIEQSSGYKILDTATINYLKGLVYIPAEHGGKKTSVWTTLQVKFNIE